MRPAQMQRNLLPVGHRPQIGQDLVGEIVQIHFLLLKGLGVLIQLAQPDNVVHQGNQPLGFLIDVTGKLLHLVRRHHTLFHQLGKAGNRGERSLELVGDVGRKLLAQPFPLLPLRHVHDQHRHTGHLPAGHHRIGDDLPGDAGNLLHRIGAYPGQRRLHRSEDLGHAAVPAQVFHLALFSLSQQLEGAVVAGQNIGAVVHQQKALAHIVGQRGELPLALAQLIHLPADGAVLLLNPGDQRRQLRIGLIHQRVVQVNLVDGVHNVPGQPEGQQGTEQQHRQHNAQHRPEDHQQHGHGRPLGTGDPEHAAILQPHRIIEVALQHGLRKTDIPACAVLQRPVNLPPVQMIFHARGIGDAVIEHRAVVIHPGHPGGAALQGIQIVLAGQIHSVDDIARLRRQLLEGLLLVMPEQHAEKQAAAEHHDQDTYQQIVLKNFLPHMITRCLQSYSPRPGRSRCSFQPLPAWPAGYGCAHPACGSPARTHSPRSGPSARCG